MNQTLFRRDSHVVQRGSRDSKRIKRYSEGICSIFKLELNLI